MMMITSKPKTAVSTSVPQSAVLAMLMLMPLAFLAVTASLLLTLGGA